MIHVQTLGLRTPETLAATANIIAVENMLNRRHKTTECVSSFLILETIMYWKL